MENNMDECLPSCEHHQWGLIWMFIPLSQTDISFIALTTKIAIFSVSLTIKKLMEFLWNRLHRLRGTKEYRENSQYFECCIFGVVHIVKNVEFQIRWQQLCWQKRFVGSGTFQAGLEFYEVAGPVGLNLIKLKVGHCWGPWIMPFNLI